MKRFADIKKKYLLTVSAGLIDEKMPQLYIVEMLIE